MKKTFTKLFAALALLAFFIPSMIAVGQTRADEVYKSCEFKTTYMSKGVSGYTNVDFFMHDGTNTTTHLWDVVNANNNNKGWNYIKIGGKNGAYTGTITTSSAYSEPITKVEMTIDAITTGNVTSMTLYTSSNNSTWTSAGTFDKSTGVKTVAISSPTANLYYKIEVVCTQGTSNGLVTISKVEYYHSTGGNPVVVTPTFTPNGGSFYESQEITITCATDGATIHYTTNGDTPTSSSTTYTEPFTINATTTVKAIGIKTNYDNSDVATATFTKATVMTVAEARDYIDDLGGETSADDVYVSGIISQIDSYNSTYHSITYWISDDGTTTNHMEVYSGKGLNGADFSAQTDLIEGSEVIVKGKVKLFNSTTYEFTQSSQIVSLTLPATPYITADDINIAYDATSGEIEYVLNNPAISGSLSVSENVDWITSATLNTIESKVNLVCTANPNAAQRSGVVTITYTYGSNNATVTKDVTVTQAGNPNIFDNIEDITAVNTSYSVKGTVVAINSRGFVMGDGTGYVYYYKNAAPTQAVSDMVTMSGTTGTYGHIIQFTNSATVAEASSSNYNGTPAATVITTVPDYSTGYHLSTYFEFEGELTKSNSNYFITLGESQIQISYPTSDQGTALTALNGKTVRVKGYFTGINSSSKFTVMLESVEEVVVPVINADDITLDHDATSGEIEYEIENTPTGTSLTAATTTADWISNINITSEKVTFTCTANDGDEDRTATFTLAYTGATSVTVTVTQGHYTVDYATLPFVWAGGVKADLIALNGVTSNGLGGDYAESHGVYRVKFDNTGDYIQVKTNEQPGIVTIGVKMIGGNTTSHIYVKGSADGETFDDGESLEISGSANDVVNLTSTRSFDATVRYVQLYFDKGANVGVGPITIAQVTNDPFITVADATVNNVPAAGDNGTLAITYGYLDISDMSDFGVQFYDAEGEEESEPDWVEVLVAEEQTGEYVVSYVVEANSGAARTAYCKVFALGDSDYVYSNLITISQVEYVDTEDYELYSGALVEGDYVIYYNGYAMKNEVISNRLSYKTVTPNSNVIAADASIVWHIAPSATEGYWTIYSADAEAYAASTGANNKAQMLAELDNDNNDMALWSVTVAESKDNTYEFVNKNNYEADPQVNHLLRNNGTYGFACYASTTGGTLSLYKKVESFTLPIAQYTSGQNDGWYLIASPVAYTLAGQDMVSGTDYDLYRFNQTATNAEWENYKAHSATDFTTLEVGRGYLYANANDITLSFTGVPSSNGVVELTYEAGHTFTGWNLVGNPLGTAATVEGDYYRMNDTHTGIMTTKGTGSVAVMEGIFVQATEAGQSVTFTAASKGVRANNTESVTLNVMRNDNVIDRAIVRFNNDRKLGKITLFDDDTKIYIPQNDGDYAIVSSNGQGTMPVNFKAKEMGMYTISVETEGIDLSYLHLIDRLTGEDVNLLIDSKYSFIASNSDIENRFILSFNENGINANGNETFAFQNGNEIIVNGEGELQVFDVMGRMVSNVIVNGVEAIALPQGVYIFRLNENIQKIVVR